LPSYLDCLQSDVKYLFGLAEQENPENHLSDSNNQDENQDTNEDQTLAPPADGTVAVLSIATSDDVNTLKELVNNIIGMLQNAKYSTSILNVIFGI